MAKSWAAAGAVVGSKPGKLRASRDAVILLLTVAAAGVDAIMIVAFGVLTAAQTGNTIMLGVAIAQGQPGTALAAGTSVVGYVVGAGLGERMIERGRVLHRGPLPVARALVAELLLLVGLLISWWSIGAHVGTGDRIVLVTLAATAMGIQSAVVLRLHVGPTTTYVTGTLTTFIMGLIRWLRFGGPEPGPAPTRQTSAVTGSGTDELPWIYGVTWSVYLAGAVIGALLYLWAHAAALLLPIALLAVVALAAHVASRGQKAHAAVTLTAHA